MTLTSHRIISAAAATATVVGGLGLTPFGRGLGPDRLPIAGAILSGLFVASPVLVLITFVGIWSSIQSKLPLLLRVILVATSTIGVFIFGSFALPLLALSGIHPGLAFSTYGLVVIGLLLRRILKYGFKQPRTAEPGATDNPVTRPARLKGGTTVYGH